MSERDGSGTSGGGPRGPGRRTERREGQGPSRGGSGERGGGRRGKKPTQGGDRRTGGPRPQAGASDRRPEERAAKRTPGSPDKPTEPDLPIDEDVTGEELDPDVADELGSLSKGAARAVARHLVMAGRLLDEDPELAYRHAQEARRRAARIGVVREAAGVAAYTMGRYADALAELRAARRITGSPEYLPMMADCERGLGRPRRALDLSADPACAGLEQEGRIEMMIVAAGARRDLGDVAAAVVSLQVPELRSQSQAQWVARLRYAYADLLEAAGRREEARRWFVRALDADHEQATDAGDRAARLDDRLA